MKDISLEPSVMVLEHFTIMRVEDIVDNGCKIKWKEEGFYTIQREKSPMKDSGKPIVWTVMVSCTIKQSEWLMVSLTIIGYN